jgi:Tol biopolymer transport system component
MTTLIRRPRVAALIGGGLVVVLVLAATGLGLRLPGLGFLDLFNDRTNLDYQSRYQDTFQPLRESFVAQRVDGRTLPAAATVRTHSSLPAQRVIREHPLTNDRFAEAYPVPSVPFTAKTETGPATRERGEPTRCAQTGSTVWYRYTAPVTATLLADTYGSAYPASIGVFSGRTLSDLTQIGCSASSTDPHIGFRAIHGTTYNFQITGTGGALVFSLEILARTMRITSASTETSNWLPQVSGDGRYVVYSTIANPLSFADVACPAAGCQVFLYDRLTKQREVISTTPQGRPSNGDSGPADISTDGRYIAFLSNATNLVANQRTCSDPSGCGEVFVRDMRTRITEMVSVSSSGEPANSCREYLGAIACFNHGVSISAHGRYVVFHSMADNLARGVGCSTQRQRADGCASQVYEHDRLTKVTRLVSVSSSGVAGNAGSKRGCVSADGRYVAYDSGATNLVPGDKNETVDIFVHDARTGRTEMVSVDDSGNQGDKFSIMNEAGAERCISSDGRYVVFQSDADNLVRDDTNGYLDQFVHDRIGHRTVRVNVSSLGEQANADSDSTHSISADGRYVAFNSVATNLVSGDTNDTEDEFIHDIVTGMTTRASLSSRGEQGNHQSQGASMSADGNVVAFMSFATNLDGKDTSSCPAPSRKVTDVTAPKGDGLFFDQTDCLDIYVHDGAHSI